METSDLHLATDNHSVAASGRSVFDSVGDVITKGVPLTGLSIYNSFVNTAVDVGNFFGADWERNDPVQQLQGYDDDLLQYYKEKGDAIEGAGLIVGSLIPGTLAIKALRVAQAGKFGQNIARATGLMSGKRDDIIKGAIAEINAGEHSLAGTLQRDKWKAIAYGFGDQALMAAAWETATIATMKANPLLDKDGFEDVMSHLFWGTVLGGGIGGVVEGIGIRGILNKALLEHDTKERAFDIATRLGIGEFNQGDRIIKLIDSIDNMPIPETASAKAKAARTRSQAELDAWKILKEISPEADENLGKAFLDTLQRMRKDVLLSKEEMYDYLGRLSRVSRINEFSKLPGEKVFYINQFDTKKGDLSKLLTSNPEEAAELSLAYTVKDFNKPIRVSRFNDTIEGGNVPKYDSRVEAFLKGEDIFIDKDLKIHVNPESENLKRVPRPGESRVLSLEEERAFRKSGKLPDKSERLFGAPLYFNVLNGSLKSSVHAVVGDLAPIENAAKLLNYDSRGRITGIKVGDFSSTQYVESGFAYHELSSLDANARYVWAHARGLQPGDIIQHNDLPMLEELDRTTKFPIHDREVAAKVKIRMPDGKLETIKDWNPASFSAFLRRKKDEIIQELLGDGSKKVDVEEVAIKANVRKEYIENGLKDLENKNWAFRPIEESLKVNHVKLEYDIGDLSIQEGNILRGLIDVQYRIDMAKDQALNAVANYFGKDWEKFYAGGFTSSDANILGAGPGAFTSANADYRTLGQRMESIGASVATKIQERRSYVSDRFTNEIIALQSDPEAAAEVAIITNIGRRITRRYAFLPEDLAAKYKVSKNTIVLEESLLKDKDGNVIGWNNNYIPRDGGTWFLGKRFNKGDRTPEGAFTYYELNEKAANFLKTSTELNDERLIHLNNWNAAQGIAKSYNLGAVYFPPVDTTRYKYVAIVREIAGKGFGTSDAAAIVADSAESLQKKVALLGDEFRISFKGTSKDYHEALGDYDYSMNLVESAVDSTLRKKGILSDILPNMRGEAAIKEYFDWHIRQEERQIRNYVELANAQLFAELRALGKKFVEVETSQTGPVAGRLFRQVKDPFNQYIKTALNISEKQEYRLWQDANEKLEAFFSTAFRTAKEVLGQADKGLISYEQAAQLTQKFGLGNPYERTLNHLEAYKEATRLPLQPVLSRFVQKANSVLAATTLRLDAFQTLINVVSTPVLLTAEFASVKANPALRNLLTTEVPDVSGAGASLAPAYSKIMYESIGDFFGPEKGSLIEKYRKLGTVRALSSEYHEMLDNLTIAANPTAKKLEEMGERAVQLGVKISRSDWAEEFVRFVASRVGHKLFEALGHSGQALDDHIRTFVNRVHGNYIAAQRPIAFQGPIGQAIGLFQTYQFNLLQQVFRYTENKERLPTALLFGIQGSLFGLQGIPGFQAINTHIVGNAANNPSHMDFYSQVPQFFDKKLGDWLLYGSVSNFLSTGLYSRGDINPRQITILPVNPLEYPAIGAGIRFVKNLVDIGARLKDGGRFSDTILQGLEHNGLSRPLTGLAQVVQGYTTTSKGSLISAANDWSSISSASRILGARPLDEAVALDALYRKTAYKAKDTARLQQLGEAVKTSLIGNRELSASELENFSAQYAAEGGRIEHFSRKMIEWSRDANQSTANSIYRSLRSPLNQNMMKIMGGEELPDFLNLPSSVTATAQVE